MKKFVIVGGGLAGVIAATQIRSFYGYNVEIILVYDHKTPSIGVGESLTPNFNNYLKTVGIAKEELIKNLNATVKVGLKFKNWLNDGNYFFHNFESYTNQDPFNLIAAHEMVHNDYNDDFCYSDFFMKNGLVPEPYVPDQNLSAQMQQMQQSFAAPSTIHIDASITGDYFLNKFKIPQKIKVIDDIVKDVVKKGENIESIILNKNGKLQGDFYIDASGFASVLFKHMGAEWVDKTDWLPLDRCIPFPLLTKFNKTLPPYTTSEATDNGWILQVPLQHRWGLGYLYCSKFTSDDEAFNKFNIWVKKNHKTTVNTDKILKFKSGYWKDQWVGNCLAIGLASGFTEPLEATNIHQTITQTHFLFNRYNFSKDCNFERKQYNELMENTFKNIYLYLRFCYTGGRKDSKFWKYMSNSVPQPVKDIENKLKYGILNSLELSHREVANFFNYVNFTRIAWGLKKPDKKIIKQIMMDRNYLAPAYNLKVKYLESYNMMKNKSVDHLEYINKVKAGIL